MSKESFGTALEAMVNDRDAASAFTDGDFTQLGNHGLTPAEQKLLQVAANEMPDVSGFTNQPLRLGYIGETEKHFSLGEARRTYGSGFGEAADYYRYELMN